MTALSDLFPGQVVIVTPIPEPIAPPNGALVYVGEATGQCVVVQPLYSDQDRARMRRQMREITERQNEIAEQIEKGQTT